MSTLQKLFLECCSTTTTEVANFVTFGINDVMSYNKIKWCHTTIIHLWEFIKEQQMTEQRSSVLNFMLEPSGTYLYV